MNGVGNNGNAARKNPPDKLQYGKDTYELNPGDSIYYDSIVAHHVHSHGTENAKILAIVYTPA